MSPLFLAAIAGTIDGTVEGIVVNYRTRKHLPDMGHTWLIVARAAALAIYLFHDGLELRWCDIPMAASIAMFFGPFHRNAINCTRRIAYRRLAWYRMKHVGYDGLWYTIAGHERGAFILATLCECLAAILVLRTFAACQ
jgi:hypothetical protein